MTLEAMNAHLRETYGLWIVQDAQGWHELMSLDYFATPKEAFDYAVEYGENINSGIKRFRYNGGEWQDS